ncbi:MAG: N-acetyl-alpha-D-glucosaminyl L-malate synthase BshA [Deltaproteobacteria bacterium]|nr:MAG: N-acetyl-alpha-D-glucosaminyl L-malate synthase BshA [Deltaproteobacteria bacterium]
MTAPLRIGIVSYPTYGGSGVIAAEVGLGMAQRGHCVHFIGTDPPRRFESAPGVAFHSVEVCDYPVFQHPPYALALASKLVEVATWASLDVIHVHYALPHATSALLAAQILGPRAPKVVTTLHGTDITIVGTDPIYLPITRHSVERSDAVTAPSRFLRDATRELLDLPTLPVEVVPNFVDCAHFAPPERRDRARMTRLFRRLGGPMDPAVDDAPTLVHVSNFRPVKRVHDVLSVFERVNAVRPARLLMIGDGPDRSSVEARVRTLGLHPRVRFLGRQSEFVEALRECDVFLLPSRSESFGVAALEAMACGVPVVASRVGGLPEVVTPGETGELVACGDVDGMARAALEIVSDPRRRERLGATAREHALTRFRDQPAIDRYEAVYRSVLGRGAV